MYIQVNSLPYHLQSALGSLDYKRKDISIEGKEQTSIQCAGGEGQRAFAMWIDFNSGKRTLYEGSYGGPNKHNPDNIVDMDGSPRDVTIHGAWIIGMQGNKTTARLVVHPYVLGKLLPKTPSGMTNREQRILAIFRSYKPAYRAKVLTSMFAKEEELNSLVQRGFLKRSSNGAVQITTDGKNACVDVRVE